MPVSEHITYEQFDLECRRLANIIAKHGKPKRLVAITRGGLVAASLLSQFLDIREIHTIGLAVYDDAHTRLEKVIEYVMPDASIDSPDTLFVDDLIDSGRTHKIIRERFPQSKMAVIYSKKPEHKLDYPAVEKYGEEWLIFPWEHPAINV